MFYLSARRFCRVLVCAALSCLGSVAAYGQTPVTTPDNAHAATSATPAVANEAERYGAVIPNAAAQQLSTTPTPTPTPVPATDLTRLGIESGRTLPLTLNETVRRALENNTDIEVARDDVRLAEASLRGLQGFYDPIFSFSPQYTRSTRAQSSSLSGAGNSSSLTTANFQFDSSVSQALTTNGISYNAFFNNNRQTTGSTFSQFSPLYNSSAGVQLTIPVLRGRKIDDTRRQIRIQRKRLEQSDAEFRRRTIEIIAQVQRAYWDLVFALRDQEIRLANLNLTRENLRRVEAQIEAGSAAPLARAEVLTELANRETDVLSATQVVSLSENVLKQLILHDAQTPDWSAALMPTDQPSFDQRPVSLPDALAEARANRPEMRRLQLARDITDVDLEYFKDQLRPRVDIQATYANTGLAGSPNNSSASTGTVNVPLISGDPALNADAFLLQQIRALAARTVPPYVVPSVPQVAVAPNLPPSNLVGGYGRALRNVLGFGTHDLTVGVNIQLPLRNRTAQANLAATQITRRQVDTQTRQLEQVIESEVRNAAQALETSRRRVLAAGEARKNAELQLAGEQKLYQVGRSTTFLLFQRENALAQARNNELRAQTDYNKALADLQRATSTTLQANNIVLESTTP